MAVSVSGESVSVSGEFQHGQVLLATCNPQSDTCHDIYEGEFAATQDSCAMLSETSQNTFHQF